MLSLKEHLRDKIQSGFYVNKTVSNKIILFDPDGKPKKPENKVYVENCNTHMSLSEYLNSIF